MRYLVILALASLLGAQSPLQPFRYVPEDAFFVAEMVGPAAWQREYAGTGLGKAFASGELQPHWAKMLEFFGEDLELGEEQRDLVEQAWSVLSGYAGRMVVAGRMDWDAVRPNATAFPGAAVLAMSGQNGFDFAKLKSAMDGLLPPGDGPEIEIGEEFVRIRQLEKAQVVGPVEHEGCLLLMVGGDLEQQVRWFLQDAKGPPVAQQEVRPSLEVAVHVDQVFDWLREAGDNVVEVAEFEPVIASLGMRSIKTASFAIRPDGPYVGQELRLDFRAADQGVFDVMMPVRRSPPRLLRYLPAGVENFTASGMDPDALRNLYQRLFRDVEDQMPISREEFEALFTEYTKLDLDRDVLSLIGDEYMHIEDLASGMEFDDVEEVSELQERANNGCFVLALRDGVKFAKNVDTAIRSRGLHVGRKRESYAGQRIYRMTLLGMLPIEYVVTDSLMVVGVGKSEETRRNLRGVLDAIAAGQDEMPPLSRELAVRLEGLPPDWSGIEAASFVEVLDGMITSFESIEAMIAERGLEPGDAGEMIPMLGFARALRPILLRHKVGASVAVDYRTKDRYLMRGRW